MNKLYREICNSRLSFLNWRIRRRETYEESLKDYARWEEKTLREKDKTLDCDLQNNTGALVLLKIKKQELSDLLVNQ